MTTDKPKLVLLLDDDDLLRTIVVRGLGRRGYEVRALEGPAAALALPPEEKAKVGLLLCDGTMAGFDPVALEADFAAHNPAVELIVSSGYTPSLLEERGIHVRPDRFLQKPWSIADLLKLTETLLG